MSPALRNFIKGVIAGGRLETDTRSKMLAPPGRAAIDLVFAQAEISSQIVGSLDASIHVRALLTSVFSIDEIFKSHPKGAVDVTK